MKNFNQIISFDENSGVITAEAGVLLKDLIIFLYLRDGFHL